MRCNYCDDSGSVTMVSGVYVTAFACKCDCRGARASKAIGMLHWNGQETQEYKGRTWWVMWAQQMGIGKTNHFQSLTAEQEPVETLTEANAKNPKQKALARIRPSAGVKALVKMA